MGLFAGCILYIHAIWMPLDYYELEFVSAFVGFVMFPLARAIGNEKMERLVPIMLKIVIIPNNNMIISDKIRLITTNEAPQEIGIPCFDKVYVLAI